MPWRKSSRSVQNGTCVEAALLSPHVATRDSKDPDGPVLLVDADTWRGFLATITS